MYKSHIDRLGAKKIWLDAKKRGSIFNDQIRTEKVKIIVFKTGVNAAYIIIYVVNYIIIYRYNVWLMAYYLSHATIVISQ